MSGNEQRHSHVLNGAMRSDWHDLRGRGVVVHAQQGSYAARRAPRILHDAQRVVDALRLLLGPIQSDSHDPIDVYVTDPFPPETESRQPAPEMADASARPNACVALVLEVNPESPGDLAAAPLTRYLLERWFGPGAAVDPLFLAGIDGLVAARMGLGSPVEEADRWVLDESEAGRPVSILASSASNDGASPGTADSPVANAHPPRDLAAISFVSFVVSSFGGTALQKYLGAYDPDRPDRAALTAFQQPLGVLEDAWLSSLRSRAGSSDALRTLLSHLLPLLRPYRRQQLAIIVYLCLAAACNVAIPLVVKWFLKDFQAFAHRGKSDPTAYFREYVLPIVGTLAGIYAFSIFVSIRRTQAVNLLNQSILNDLQLRMFARLMSLPHSFHSRVKLGDVMTRLTGDLDNVQSAISQLTNKTVYQTFMLIGGIIGLLLANGPSILTLLILLIVPLFALVYARLRNYNKSASREQRKRVGQTASAAQEYLSAQAVIKAFGMEKRVTSAFQSRIEAQKMSKLRLALLGTLTDLSEDVATALAQVTIFGVGGYLILVHPGTGVRIEDLVASLLLIKYVIGPVASLSGIGQTLHQASGSMERVNELFEEPLTIADSPDAVDLPPLAQAITLEGVTFGYEDRHPVLLDLSLRIPAGSNVAIVGPSGSGKSTIMNLLMRFWDPVGGRVVFDGHDLRDVTLASLREQIGVVLQDTFVFDSTVRENIAIGRPQSTEAEITAAAAAAQLDTDIRAMPRGYDTVLGERGVRMSGGQRQRLAIARAILRDPRILILDEATSALDAQTEAGIMQTLSTLKRGRTVISVTHRLSWAKEADTIFVLDGGRLVEEGSHSALAAAGGLYERLYEEQVAQVAEQAMRPTLVDPMQLRGVPLFAGLSQDLMTLLANQVRAEWHSAGADIVRQGDPADKLYLIEHGEVEVLLTDRNGERLIRSLSDGDYFGEIAILTGTVRSATVRTSVRTLLYSLSRADFLALLDRDSTIRATIEATVASRRAGLEAILAGANSVESAVVG